MKIVIIVSNQTIFLLPRSLHQYDTFYYFFFHDTFLYRPIKQSSVLPRSLHRHDTFYDTFLSIKHFYFKNCIFLPINFCINQTILLLPRSLHRHERSHVGAQQPRPPLPNIALIQTIFRLVRSLHWLLVMILSVSYADESNNFPFSSQFASSRYFL